mgnify:CR=1 FL=1
MSNLTTSEPTRTADSGRVKHMSPVRWERWRGGRGAVQVQDGSSLRSPGPPRTQRDPWMSKLATSDPTRTAYSGHVTAMSPVRWDR